MIREVRIFESNMSGAVKPFLDDYLVSFVHGCFLRSFQLKPPRLELNRVVVINPTL